MNTAVRRLDTRSAVLDEVRRRVPQPVEALEIAAVLESIGITDAVAREDHGAESSFELAEQVFGVVRPRDDEPSPAGHVVDRARPPLDVETAPGRGDTSARSLVALAPLALLLGSTQALSEAGWAAGAILALSAGVGAAMLLTTGPILAIGRRASIFLSFGYRASAQRFLSLWSLATLALCALVATLALGLATEYELFTPAERAIFAVTLPAFAVFWLLAVGLTVLRAAAWVVAVLVVALLSGLAAGIADGPEGGVVTAYCLAVAGLAAVWLLVRPRRAERHVRLPVGATLVEASPYVAVGSAFACFIVLPHALGWFGGGGGTTLDRLVVLELSLLVAIVPLLLASGVGDWLLRSFWGVAKTLREEESIDGFCRRAARHVLGGLVRYALVLVVLSAATAAVVEVAIRRGGLDHLSRPVFWLGLAGFLLLGVGQYSNTFVLGFSLPGRALAPPLVALAVLCVVGIPLSTKDYRLAALAFALAAAAFAAAATVACVRVLADVPRRYSTAF